MNLFGTAFLLVLLSIITNAARTPQFINPCSMKCSFEEDRIFKPGQKYVYSYEGESNIKTTKGSYETTGVKIKSKVTITGLSNCEMKLSLSDVQIFDKTSSDGNQFKESPNSYKFKSALEMNDIFFTKESNEVKSVCMDGEEPVWSGNIKKAILDSLANQGIQTKPDSYKKTSHGKCFITSSEKSPKEETNPNSVNFQYDLQTCDNKMISNSLFGDITRSVIFKTSQVSCKYLYKDQSNLVSIRCREEYKTATIKTNENQMVVEITTNIYKENQLPSPDRTFTNKNMFETGIEQAEDEIEAEESPYSAAKTTLKDICVQYKSSESSKIPKLFMELVNHLKRLNSKEFKELYLELQKSDICPEKTTEIKSIFYDASGFVNTRSSISVMVDLIKTSRISLFDQNIWLTSLSFMQEVPSIETLKELETIISVANPSTPLFLSLGSLTHLYCKEEPESCQNDPIIASIVSAFLHNLNGDCSIPKDATDDYVTKIQISLKGLGNLKYYPATVINTLNKCITKDTNKLSIRISALEVMKHMDCKQDRSSALSILLNNENDSELRINAYLTVMGCSDINTLFKVREILSKEKVNQVGSFIWTHLTNIKESNDQLKENIRDLLDDVDLKKEFDISKLKFSRNIEKTFLTNNYGVNFDSNVIFSEKSFVPRSVSLNTTASIFSKSTNFLEMSARLEGLEDLLFKIFGPEGYLKKEKGAQENLELINILNEMSGSVNIKLFGNQVSFIELIRGTLSSVKKYNIIEEIMYWSQDKSLDFNKNLQLVDKTVVIPTLLGFPLKFKLQGSAAINIKIKSKFDVAGLVSWPISMNIDNYISPNINAELHSEIVYQTPFTNYGMRMKLKSGTNTEFKATIFTNKNEELSVKFDSPKTTQNIFSVEGNAYVIHRDKEIIQLQDKLKEIKMCTSEMTVRILGIRVCGEAKVLDPSTRKDALLFGPFAANLFIEKIDTQTEYILLATSKTSAFISQTGKVYSNRHIKFEFNTPNSKFYNRRFYGEILMDFKQKEFKLELVTPWTDALVAARLKLTDGETKIAFNFKANKQNIIDISAEHLIFSSPKRTNTKGGISIQILNLTPIRKRWNLELTDDAYSFTFVSKGLLKEETHLKIKVLRKNPMKNLSAFNTYEISGFFNTYFGYGKISGRTSENYFGHRWDIKISHKNKQRKEYQIIFRHKVEDKSSKNLNKYILTTTFNYGEKAENFVTLKTENELSDKHIRTSMKASYGGKETPNNKAYEEEMSMKLYGGYTWKSDDIYYAEGSLSFKLPSKNLNYEGRYISEIGKRVFKLSLDFDKDQQSKINLKINYLQPKLYLKDTDFSVLFSLPYHNFDLKWKLMEIDVNKYTYTLDGKYNTYDMKIDGVHTQISRLDHDSYVSIKMPRIQGLPTDVKGKLRVNLVDMAKAKIKGGIEIPNTDYKYSFDSEFSYIPNNLLEISKSEISSVLTYNIEVSSKQRLMKSKFIFTCNPEEFRTLFNVDLNGNSNSDNKIEFDIQALQKNPVYKQFESVARLALQYPGNRHSIGFKSDFKYSEMVAQIDLIWNKNQRISITSTYQLDNSWTQKGLAASLTVKTPFIGYEQIHFGMTAVGQLRYRKVNFECKWADNKKLIFDIVIQPKSSSDFSLNAKLTSPFKGFNLVTFQAKHLQTSNSINTQCVVEIGPVKRYQIKFEAINNSEDKNRDFLSNILIESGIYPAFKMSLLHKDDSVHYKSQFDVLWMKTQSINVKSDISFNLEDYEFTTKGNVELFSTIKEAKQMKMVWSLENRDSQFLHNVQMFHNNKNLFQTTIKGFYETEDNKIKIEFNGVASVMNGRSMKIANILIYSPLSIQNQFSVSQETNIIYSHNFNMNSKSLKLKLLIPNIQTKKVEFEYKIDRKQEEAESQIFVKINEKHLFHIEMEEKYQRVEENEIKIEKILKFMSDYATVKNFETKTDIKIKPEFFKVDFKLKSENLVLLTVTAEVLKELHKKKIQLVINSKYESLKQLKFDWEHIYKDSDSSFTNSLDFNMNKIIHFNSKINLRGFELIKIDMMLKKRDYVRYFKLKHSRHLLGFEDQMDTNLFSEKFKFTNTIISRGGISVQFRLQTNLFFFKSIEIFGRFSKEHEIKVFYQLPRDSNKIEKIKVIFSNFQGIQKLTVDTTTLFKLEFNFDRKQFKTILFDFKFLPNSDESAVKFKFNFDGNRNALKHSSELKLNIGNRKFEIENKVEKVKWSYLLFETEIKTNDNNFKNYRTGFEYKIRPSKYSTDVKLFFNDKFIKLSSELDSSFGSKVELKIETSFEVLKEVSFELKHKQNSMMTQVTHKCKTVIKSFDNFLRLQNEIEWSGFNYVKVESTFEGNLSDNRYAFEPKSLKFLHQYHKGIMKDNFQLSMSKNRHFKFQLEVPLNRKSKSLFELESSFQNLKQLTIDFNINFSENEEKSLALKIVRNNEIAINMESKLKHQEKFILMTVDLDTVGNFKSGLSIELVENSFGTKTVKVKLVSSLLKESIILITKVNIQKKEISLSLTGAIDQQASFYGKVSKSQNLIQIKYGKHKFDFETLVDKNDGFKLLKVSLFSIVKFNTELTRSSNYLGLKGDFDNHSLQISYNYKRELKVEFNIKHIFGALKINQIISDSNINYKIEGKSNIPEWTTMHTELDMTKSTKGFTMVFYIKKENRDALKLNFEQKFFQSITFTYSSIHKLFKTGKLEINYENFPQKLNMKFDGKNSISQPITAEYELNATSFSGKITSPFEWLQSCSIKGQLTISNDEVKGKFDINHNKLKQPINGEITIQRKFDLLKVELKTPFLYPLNQLSFRNERSDSILIIELNDAQNQLFYYKLKTYSKAKYDLDASITIPKLLSEFKLSSFSNFDFENPTKSIKFLVKSNQFSDTSLSATYNLIQNEYKIQFSHPKKDGHFVLKISQYQESGKQIELSAQIGDMKHEAEIVYQIKDPNDVFIKSTVKCISHFSSPASFELNYKHKLNMPKNFNIDTQLRFNDKTVLDKTISWKLQSDYSFDFVGKMTVSPQTKEYENKIELSNKRGEIFELIISATEILRDEIKVRVVRKEDNLEILLKTPFEYTKSVNFNIQKELKPNSWTQRMTFSTNTLGKYELISEYKLLSNAEIEISNQINTPTTNRKAYIQINLKNSDSDQSLIGLVEIVGQTYQLSLSRQNRHLQIKINSPFEHLKKFELSMKDKSNFYEIEVFYNHYQMKTIVSQNQEISSLLIQSNTDYFKIISLSIENSMADNLEKSIKIKIKMDEKYFKTDFKINCNKRSLEFNSENDLINYLPKSFSGKVQLSLAPIDIAMELKINDNTPVNFIFHRDQFLISFKRNSKSRISIEISKKIKNQLDAKFQLDNDEYSMRTVVDNSREKLTFSINALKNKVNKLIEFNSEIGKRNGNLEMEIEYLSNTVFKFKFTNENLPDRKLSIEMRLFSFNGVTDLIVQRKPSETNLKFSWNLLFNEQQLHIGSIIYGIKSSTPINYLAILNLQKVSYEIQLIQSENGEFQFKLSSPIKILDFEAKYQLEKKLNSYKMWLTWRNNLIGEYSIKSRIQFNQDPEIKFLFSSFRPIVQFKWAMKTSVANEISINTELGLLDWEKLSFDFQLSTKQLIKLIAVLKTPFKPIKNIQITKNIKFISFFDHKYETIIIYNGITNIKYIGSHEVKFSEKIFKFQGGFHNDNTKLIAVNISHTGNHKEMDHSVIWHVRNQKFGWKFNGGFRPLFEGKSEIYTPFHETGKIVLLGKHMGQGIMLEAGDRNQRLGSFEYMNEKDVQMMKITPPKNYGKPLTVKYSSKRLRRSVGNEMETDVTYGVEKLLEWASKFEMTSDEYNALINFKIPKFTEKAAELSLKHNYRDKTWNFDHQLTIKDQESKVYRLFGKLFMESLRNLKVSMNAEHPTFGSMHMSIGHSWTPNQYGHHFVMKSNDKTWITHSGNVKYNFDESSFSTEWKTGMNSKHYTVKASHSGIWKKFLQSLIMEYNDIPHLIFKSEVIPNEQSEVEINFPQLNSMKWKMIINNNKNKIDLICELKSDKYVLEATGTLKHFEIQLNLNEKNIGSLLIKYDRLKLSVEGKYLKNFCTVEMAFQESTISLIVKSSNKKLEKLQLMISANKMSFGIDHYGTPYAIETEYDYAPNSLIIKINSSFKQLSKFALRFQPKQITLELNEFYQKVDYLFTQHHVKLISKNNFLPIQNFLFEVLIENPNNATWKLTVDTFDTVSKIKFTNDKLSFENRNNYFRVRSLEMEANVKIEKEFTGYTGLLVMNKQQILKIQMANKQQLYFVKLETYLGEHLVASYNVPLKEMIISFKFKENFLNIIQKFQETVKGSSKTFIFNFTIESSHAYLYSFDNSATLTVSDSSYSLRTISEYNTKKVEFRGELSRTKLFCHLRLKYSEFALRLIRTNNDKINIELQAPNNKIMMTLEKEKNKYSTILQFNNKEILVIRTKQNSNIETSVEHESTVEFYGRQVWNYKFKTDYKRYGMKMTAPTTFDMIITNDWNKNEKTKLGFWVKYLLNGKSTECGAGLNFLLTSQSSSVEVNLENQYHIIRLMKTIEMTKNKQITTELINKNTKESWIVIFTMVKDKTIELEWKTPTSNRKIKYNEIVINNVKTSIDLDIVDSLKLTLKTDETDPKIWTGSLSLFKVRIAEIETGKDYVQATINKDGTENNRIFLKWTTSSEGEWKKDYIRTRQVAIVQKSLNINVDIVQKTVMKTSVYSTMTTMKYQLIDKSMKTLKIGASIDFSEKNKIVIDLPNPYMPIKTILIRSQPNQSQLTYQMETYLNENSKVHGYFTIKTGSNPGVMTRLYYNPEDKSEFFHLHSKYIDDRQMETIVYKNIDETKTTYFQVLFRLLNEHHIESTFAIKLDTISTAIKAIRQIKYIAQSKFSDLVINEIKWIALETNNRYNQLKDKIPNFTTMQNQMVLFLRTIKIEMNSFSKELSEIIAKNEFFIQTISEKVYKCLSVRFFLYKFASKVVYVVERALKTVFKILKSKIQDIFMFNCRLYYFSSGIVSWITGPITSLTKAFFKNYFPLAQKYFVNNLEKIKISLDQTLNMIFSTYVQIQKFIKLSILNHTFKIVEKTIEIAKSTLQIIMSGSLDFLKHENELKNLYKNLISCLEKFSKAILNKIDNLMNQVDSNLNNVIGAKFFYIITKSVSTVSSYVIDQMKDEENQKIITSFVYYSIASPLNDWMHKIQIFTMDSINPYSFVIYERKNKQLLNENEFSITVRMTSPIPFNDFKSLPDFGYVRRKIHKIQAAINLIKQTIKNQLANGCRYFELRSWFTLYFPQTSFTSILPEFETYATISKRSVMTFDKASFTLSPDSCRVLLSKDLKFQKWEIIMNQQNNKQMFTINIGSNTFELSASNYKVNLNGKPSDLPIQIGSTSLVGLGRMMKLKDDKLGLTITIDPVNEMFTVGISGWYHGKVRGLFGNSDNEPFNDFMLDNGKIVSNEVFMKEISYKSQSCKVVSDEEQTVVKPIKGCPFIRRMVCKFLFKCPFSPLAACFNKVNPKKFHKLCVHSTEEVLTKLDPSICKAARQYQAQCQKAGVNIQVPPPCKKCDMPNDKPLSINEFRNVKIKEKVSDIVFIVDEGTCLNSLYDKLPILVTRLDKGMKTKGINSVHYGLVTYVDDNKNQANFHTVGQKLLGSSQEMITSLKTLKSSNGKFKDLTGAITTAANYPFREHASRHLIIISCTSTKEYPNVLHNLVDKLTKKAIQVSLLTDFSFKLKDSNKQSIIFGVDSQNTYTALSRNGDKNFTSRPESDFLYQLTMKMKGVVFDNKYLSASQELTRIRFVSSFANQISLRATPAKSSRCVCVDDGDYNCTPLDTHTIFPVKRA